MRTEDLHPNIRVQISADHPSGYGGQIGRVVAVEVTVDIGEPLLIRIDPESLERMPEDPLPPGWEEFDI
ncbi:hypothetical protein D3C86_2185740 [compost metagenome]